MNSRIVVRAGLALMLSFMPACGQGSDGSNDGGNGGGGGGGNGGGGNGEGGDGSRCRNDRVEPSLPRVQIRLPDGTTRLVTGATDAPCGTIVRVDQAGTGHVRLDGEANCALSQLGTKTAELVTRSPEGKLFQMTRGNALCVLPGPRQIDACGLGTMSLVGWAGRARCDADPEFRVASYAGQVEGVDPAGESFVLEAGTELIFDFDDGSSSTDTAVFSDAEVATLQELAAELGMELPSPSPPTEGPPQNLIAPRIDVGGEPGQLTAAPGEWTGATSFDYQWLGHCDVEGSGCVDIEDATSDSYTPEFEDCFYVVVAVSPVDETGAVFDPVFSAPFPLQEVGVPCGSVG